jgi:hypothetical protein
MDEGKARMRANEPLRAIEAIQKAHDIMHVPTTGVALARAHLAAGHLVEARDVALEVGRMPHDPNEPSVFDAARKQAKELDVQLKPRIPTLRIRIKGSANRVAIDDTEIALAVINEPVAVNPGKRIVTAKGEGGDARGEVDLTEREVREIELTLSPHADSGKPVATTTGQSTPSAPSSSSSSSSPSSSSSSSETKIRLGTDDTEPRGGVRTPLAQGLMYGGIVVGGLGLAVGFITGALTFSKASDVSPLCDNNICAPEASDSLDSASTFATISTISFIVGVAGAAAAVIGYTLPKDKTRSHHALTIGPTGIGATF